MALIRALLGVGACFMPACAFDVSVFAGHDGGSSLGNSGREPPDAATDAPTNPPDSAGRALASSALGVGAYHACAQTDSGVYCWGANQYGQLGLQPSGAPTEEPEPPDRVAVPKRMQTTRRFSQLSAGESFTCGLEEETDVVLCWGSNRAGQLGDGTTMDSIVPKAVALPADFRAATIASGVFHSCAVGADGGAFCWGNNRFHVLGVPVVASPDEDDPQPTPVALLGRWNAVAGGRHHTCGVQEDGTLWCWGLNNWLQLGDDGGDRSEPQRIGDWSDWQTVSCGQHQTCGLRGGDVYCWGARAEDLLTTFASSPQRITSTGSFVEVSVGMWQSCARSRDGSAACWGRNTEGQIRGGGPDFYLDPIATVEAGWQSLKVGHFHLCGRYEDRTIRCRGQNVFGQLGSGIVEGDIEESVVALTDP